VLEDCDHEDAAWDVDLGLPGCAREALALFEALQPVIPIAIALGAGPAPGADPGEDACWAVRVAWARRRVLSQQAGGIDQGLATDNLRLLDRIDELIDVWPEDDWEDGVRDRVQELVEACQRGRARGEALRQSRQQTEDEDRVSVGWLLRHPADHWLRSARPTVSDHECRGLIEAQIARLAPNYEQLCRLDWSGEEATVDVVCEMQVVSVSPARWKEPVSAVVTAPIKGDTSLGERIEVGLVEDPGAAFNGSLVSLLPGDRWRLCARRRENETLLPLDGTRRLAMSGD
jgi:hypothetical protein